LQQSKEEEEKREEEKENGMIACHSYVCIVKFSLWEWRLNHWMKREIYICLHYVI